MKYSRKYFQWFAFLLLGLLGVGEALVIVATTFSGLDPIGAYSITVLTDEP